MKEPPLGRCRRNAAFSHFVAAESLVKVELHHATALPSPDSASIARSSSSYRLNISTSC